MAVHAGYELLQLASLWLRACYGKVQLRSQGPEEPKCLPSTYFALGELQGTCAKTVYYYSYNIRHICRQWSRAAQLIAIVSKSQYGLVQYPNRRGAQYLLMAKYVSNRSEIKYCGSALTSRPTYTILQTTENIFVWYRSSQQSHYNHFNFFQC